MELRYAQLMKQQEKMVQEMERSVAHREIIVNRTEGENKTSSKKVETFLFKVVQHVLNLDTV